MKGATEWIDEFTDKYAFDMLDSMDSAVAMIRKIQADAYFDGMGSMLEGEEE